MGQSSALCGLIQMKWNAKKPPLHWGKPHLKWLPESHWDASRAVPFPLTWPGEYGNGQEKSALK